MRWVIALVLPVPAPARMQTGPRTASAAERCSGSSALKISGSATAVTGPSWQGRPTPRESRGRTVKEEPRVVDSCPGYAERRHDAIRRSSTSDRLNRASQRAGDLQHDVVRVLPHAEAPAGRRGN